MAKSFGADRDSAQLIDVFSVMSDGAWRTFTEINRDAACGPYPTQSISARLRDLRKKDFGGFVIVRRRRARQLHEYRLMGN